jgi:organic hydroperoxide reductase OsmC/OhrA
MSSETKPYQPTPEELAGDSWAACYASQMEALPLRPLPPEPEESHEHHQ